MSFVWNFEENQSPNHAGGIGPAPQSIPSERATFKVTTTFSSVADIFVCNFSDNQSPVDGGSPNVSVTTVPGSLASAANASSADEVISWNMNRGLEVAGQKSQKPDREEGIAKSQHGSTSESVIGSAATQQGVERTMDKMKNSSRTDVRESELLLPL